MQILRSVILSCGDFLGFALRKEPKPLKLKNWLGGLDSNQDNQIQNLMYCQLYDLPAEGRTQQKRAVGTTLSTTLAAHRVFVNRPPHCFQAAGADFAH